MSCQKKSPVEHNYLSTVIATDLPPIMGSCIDSTGALLVFSLPLLNDNFYSTLLSAKIIRFTNLGSNKTIHDYGEKTFSNGAWTKDTYAGVTGWIPNNVKVNLVQNNLGQIYISYNNGYHIDKLSNFSISTACYLNKIIAMSTNKNDGVFAIASPGYTGEYPFEISQAPIIYEVYNMNHNSLYFTFPDNINYQSTCGYSGSSTLMFPTDINIDMAVDTKKNIFINFGYDNIIYKLDTNKNLTTYINDIFFPVSIAFDRFDRLFIVSAPKFEKNANDLFTMVKPVEIFLNKSATENKKIYEGKLETEEIGGCWYYDEIFDGLLLNERMYDISINYNNDIFLLDNNKGEIILIR